ncbi:hypothetical protein Tco_1059374 [Tanacetum coccineum]
MVVAVVCGVDDDGTHDGRWRWGEADVGGVWEAFIVWGVWALPWRMDCVVCGACGLPGGDGRRSGPESGWWIVGDLGWSSFLVLDGKFRRKKTFHKAGGDVKLVGWWDVAVRKEIFDGENPRCYRKGVALGKDMIRFWKEGHISRVMFSNLKKCLADANLHVPLDEIKIDKTLYFVEEHVEIIDRGVKSLKT